MKVAYCLLSLVLFCCNVSGQIEFGMKAGLSLPCLISTSSDNPESKGYRSIRGHDFSVYVERVYTRNFSFRMQLEYAIEGGRKRGNQAFTDVPQVNDILPPGEQASYLYANYNSELRIAYLMVPLQAKFNVEVSDHWGLFFIAGPFIGFPVSARNRTSGSSIVYFDEKHTKPLTEDLQVLDGDENVRNIIRSFNAGVSESMGINYRSRRHKIFFETGGNFGFVNIYKSKKRGINHTGNMTASIGYGLYFSLPTRR